MFDRTLRRVLVAAVDQHHPVGEDFRVVYDAWPLFHLVVHLCALTRGALHDEIIVANQSMLASVKSTNHVHFYVLTFVWFK